VAADVAASVLSGAIEDDAARGGRSPYSRTVCRGGSTGFTGDFPEAEVMADGARAVPANRAGAI